MQGNCDGGSFTEYRNRSAWTDVSIVSISPWSQIGPCSVGRNGTLLCRQDNRAHLCPDLCLDPADAGTLTALRFFKKMCMSATAAADSVAFIQQADLLEERTLGGLYTCAVGDRARRAAVQRITIVWDTSTCHTLSCSEMCALASPPPCSPPFNTTQSWFNGQPRPRSTTQHKNLYQCKNERKNRIGIVLVVILHLIACEAVRVETFSRRYPALVLQTHKSSHKLL
jgi:hypothetical protein